jgi:predicted transcriptional regulator
MREVRMRETDGDGDVDEEDPAPGVVVGDPAAERGADGGREDDRHAIDGEGLAALVRRESVGEDGLLAGLQAAAAGSLEHAEEDEERERGREAAEHGADAEQRDADHVEALATEEADEVGAHREDDGVGDEVGGQDPGGFVLGGAEAAGDVGEGDVGDGGVEDLHEGRQGNGKRDGPRIMFGLPVGVGVLGHG